MAAIGLLLLAAAALLGGCAGTPAKSPALAASERAGLSLQVELNATRDALLVSTVLANGRSTSVHLVPDQCGRVTEALLVRTTFEPEGRRWTGSLQAVKEHILRDQASRQHPDRFHPRRPSDTSSDTPPCARPERPIELAPGETIRERWELPVRFATALDAVGSENTVVRVESVEARGADEVEFLDILPTGTAEGVRAGRNIRVEEAVSSVLRHRPQGAESAPSLAELYDRLLENVELRTWIEAQPEDTWRYAGLTPSSPFEPETEQVRLEVVTTRFEREAVATARADGSDVVVLLPGERDRTRIFPRRPGTTPPGVDLIDDPDALLLLDDDVLPGSVFLPSGRVIVAEYLFDAEPLGFEVAPGAYPVHATLARDRDKGWTAVAFGTLVLSQEPTVRWEDAGVIAVDAGSTTITSPEGAAVLRDAFDRNEAEWESLTERIFTSRTAHDYLVTEFSLGPGVNLVEFGSGIGDGGYPVVVGYDAAGRPTRVVVDFLLLHLDWPA